MDLKEQAKAARDEAEEILENSTAIMFQYALPTLTDRYLSGDDESPELGKAVILGANALLFFASSAAVTLCSILDSQTAEGDDIKRVGEELEERLEGLRTAFQALNELDDQLTGKPGGDA